MRPRSPACVSGGSATLRIGYPSPTFQKAVAIADKDDEIQSPENLRIETENKPGFVIARDLLVAEVDGPLVTGTPTARRRSAMTTRSTTSGDASIRIGDAAGSAGRCSTGTSGARANEQPPSRSSPTL